MFCVRCGTRVTAEAEYCQACGKPAAGVPLMPSTSRLGGHVRLAGILWIAISAVRLLPGLFLIMIASEWHGFPPEVPSFVYDLLGIVGSFLIAGAIFGAITGYGLLRRQGWARMAAIVLACVGLLDVPFGTALGIYTLWVLLPAHSEQEYRQMSKAA